MEEIDIKICLKKINKAKRILKKIIKKQKNQYKKFFFTWYKYGTKSFDFQ